MRARSTRTRRHPPPDTPTDNAVNGVPSCASDWLLGTLLRDSWQFDGYVTSGERGVCSAAVHVSAAGGGALAPT